MQNYEQILQELGIEVPAEKREDLKKKMGENYRTKADYDKAVEKRDEYKASLEDVQGKLDGFKDVNVDDLKGQIQTLTTQLNDEKSARAKDAQRVELEKTVNDFLSSVGEDGEKLYPFLNDITEEHYRVALMEELEKDSAKGKSIGDIFKPMITDKEGNQKAGIFIDKEQVAAGRSAARFMQSMGTGRQSQGQKYTMAQLMKMKNDNPNLDIKKYM